MSQKAEVERAIIGTILYEPSTFKYFRHHPHPEDFSDPLCRKVYTGIRRLADERLPITVFSVAMETGVSEVDLTGLSLLERVSEVASLSRFHSEEVLRDGFRSLKSSLDAEADVFDQLKVLDSTAAEAHRIVLRHRQPSKPEAEESFRSYILKNQSKGVRYVPTGFPTLDRMAAGGLSPGNMTLLGGIPGSGKTSFALSIALAAARAGNAVTMVEAEMPSNEIYERLVGIMSGVSIDEIRSGQNYDQVTAPALDELSRLPLAVMEVADRTPENLASLIKQAADEGKQLVIVDYLQPFSAFGRSASDEFYGIRRVSETVRGLALKYNIHLLVLSALNRNEAASSRPTLHSLYGSSGLGHDAALVLILSSESNDLEELTARLRFVTCDVVKNRSGARGSFNMRYELNCQRFYEIMEMDTVGSGENVGRDTRSE